MEKSYFPALNGLRGVAVLLVFLSHAEVYGFLEAGGTGVSIFFSLSGFLITFLLMKEYEDTKKISLFQFYMRRALRLVPLLLLISLLGLYLGYIDLVQFVSVLFYFGNFRRLLGDDLGYLHHTWSLAIEEQFYIVWPILVLLFAKIRREKFIWLIASVFVLLTIWRVSLWIITGSIIRVHFGTDTNFPAILAGCLSAIYLRTHGSLKIFSLTRYYSYILGIAILSGMLRLVGIADSFVYTDSFTFTISWPLTAALTSLLILELMAKNPKRSFLEWAVLGYLGRISYAFYLFHTPIIRKFKQFGIPAIPLSAFITTLLLASISYYSIERPFLYLKDRGKKF